LKLFRSKPAKWPKLKSKKPSRQIFSNSQADASDSLDLPQPPSPPSKYDKLEGRKLRELCEGRGLSYRGAKCDMVRELVRFDYTDRKEKLVNYFLEVAPFDNDGQLRNSALEQELKSRKEGTEMKKKLQKDYHKRRLRVIQKEYLADLEADVFFKNEMSAMVVEAIQPKSGVTDMRDFAPKSTARISKSNGPITTLNISKEKKHAINASSDGDLFVEDNTQHKVREFS
jgi:hypothetical protein